MKPKQKINKLIISYIKSYIGMRSHYRPLFGHLWLTHNCNLECSYCLVHDHDGKVMDFQTAKKSADILWRLGVRIVGFMGGEPVLHPRVYDIIKLFSERGFITYLSTNGYLLNQKNIQRSVESGIDVIDLSLDSVKESSVSMKTVKNNNKAMNELLAASRDGCYVFKVNTVLTSKNWRDALSVVEYCIARKIRVSVGIESTPTESPSPFSTSDKLNNHDDLLFAAERLIKIKRAFPALLVDPLAYFQTFKKKIKKREQLWPCSVGTVIAQIDWDGYFFECSKMLDKSKELTVYNATPESFTETIRKWRKNNLKQCNKRCLSNCAYNISYLKRHPITFLSQFGKSYT